MLRCGPCCHVVAARFSAFFASHISRISGSSNTRRTVGQLWGPSAPGTHNPQGSLGRNGHIGVAALLLTKNKATPGIPRVSASARPTNRRQRPPRGQPRSGPRNTSFTRAFFPAREPLSTAQLTYTTSAYMPLWFVFMDIGFIERSSACQGVGSSPGERWGLVHGRCWASWLARAADRHYSSRGRSPSSSGLGLRPFTAATRVRIPLGMRGRLLCGAPEPGCRAVKIPISQNRGVPLELPGLVRASRSRNWPRGAVG